MVGNSNINDLRIRTPEWLAPGLRKQRISAVVFGLVAVRTLFANFSFVSNSAILVASSHDFEREPQLRVVGLSQTIPLIGNLP